MAQVRVGDWTLDPSDGTLASPEARKRLEPKVQAVLLLLIDRRGTVVSQDEIFREVWPGTYVAPTALARTISVLRTAFEDDVRQPRYIETVPKRGYRFIAAVEPVIAAEPVAAPEPPGRFARSPRYAGAAAAAMALVLAAGHVAPLPPPVESPRVESNGAPSNGATSHDAAAPGVLRFQFRHDSRVGNEQAYEYYTRELARDPGSLKALSGLAIVYAFRSIYQPDAARWIALALDTAERAAAMAPSNAFAANALAIAHAQAGQLKNATAGFQRAILLSPADPAARTNLGHTLRRAGRLDASLRVFEELLAGEPHWSHGYAFAAGALASAGYLDEAVRVAEAGIAREPRSLFAHLTLIHADLLSGRYASAKSRLQRLAEAHADFAVCIEQLGLVEQLLGNEDEARRHYERARIMSPGSSIASLRLAQLRMLAHDRAGAEGLLREVEGQERWIMQLGVDASEPRWLLAAAAAVRGDREGALQWYARAIEAGHADVMWDRWDPLLGSLRQTAAFTTLSDRLQSDHRAVAPLVERIVSHVPRKLARR